MTNPIMPGIEKLAEKYGINVDRKPEFKPNNNTIEENDDCYILKNIKYESIFGDVLLTKKLLERGQNYNYDTWRNIKVLKTQNHVNYEIPSLHGYFDIFEYLYSKHVDSNLSHKIIDMFHSDFTTNLMITSSNITYDDFIDLYYRNFYSKLANQAKMQGVSSFINSPNITNNYLTDLTGKNRENIKKLVNYFFNPENSYIKKKIMAKKINTPISIYIKGKIFCIDTQNDDEKTIYAARGIKFLRRF